MPSSDDAPQLSPVPKPTPWPDANRRLLLGQGAPIDPLIRLASFTADEFERFIWEWVNGYIARKYNEVQHRGGAGDKGRDVVGWLDDPSIKPRRWDLYQCKGYKDPLTPSDFLPELGKLCHFTFRGDYTRPEYYFIVSPKGVGNSLQDLIDDPTAMRAKLTEKWDSWCLNAITETGPVALVGAFREHVEAFDFSILRTLPPSELIEQHKQTKYHLPVFGTAFKPRPPVCSPPPNITQVETTYVARVYDAFADHLKVRVASPEDFSQHMHLTQCFNHARECFYSAESLKEFSRDNLPDDSAYTNLRKQIRQGITATLNKLHSDGYQKLVDVSEKVVGVEITSNILATELEPSDRVGLCHHLANDNEITWVVK
jgi:hypothetical protein